VEELFALFQNVSTTVIMKIDTEEFRVPPGKKIKLKKWPSRLKPFYASEEQYQRTLRLHIRDLAHQQGRLYAYNRYALLLIFQAMDAAGKDSAIKHVMSGINPQGCQVFSFKAPSAEELAHDFLWRTTCCLPARGRIGIFNRSYYEEVLVARVHPEILHSQGLPSELVEEKNIWKQRYRSINDLERHLYYNGTRVIKFFLHLSKEEQRRRFLRRIDEPQKNWKFSMDDIRERQLWKQYVKAYEACLGATSSEHCPWYIVPADDKKNAHLILSEIILEQMRQLRMGPSALDGKRLRELRSLRKVLAPASR
jgi:PPK2 family polyphosphate:nucleotide phosphotransferase